ncbi:eukaryotic translation initiation factor 3 subunit A [Schistocerca nitens]|uniref:eukaryotic translation initiation factor 3 subunit A n=1 Tax=Schistocerca nitens TaxID=7011 RepID=UPI002118EFA9|nr:eukaryotic translation initiation factor 3 subunit A [Schistocerca nitens]
MARYVQRPENALKRANEFIEVGKPARALDTLYEVFRNKKWAYNWSESVLEPIMFKYLDLCVELKKSHIAKEGLFQYRNMFQSVNVSSLENVIRGYLRTAEERTESAREQSQQAVVDIDDLDMLATPESILLSAVSGEDAQDRSDRTILTPWVKFLWESYCQCLELLRTNAHVETLYHDIARMAFSFCLKYNRKTEFRKLCDKLRKHLEDISKLPPQTANVSIQKPETQQLNLDTRLVQLDSAIQMELWQEAYKAIEDIHGLMNLSKKPPVPKTMANYYQKLAMVFWKAGNHLFHAAAHFKLFQLSKEMKKNITPEDLQRMACRLLLATLAIPLPSAHPEFDRFIETDKSPLEKAQRLAILLGLPQPPTRQSLLRDIVRFNVVGLASPQLQELYMYLEVEFHPLQLCARVEALVKELQADESSPLFQYISALQDVTLVRLVRQIAQVYQTIEFSRLLELARFASPFHLERLLVDCVRHNDMQIRIDHAKQCVHFGMDLSESQREDIPEGPTLQNMPSEQVRNQLVNMATVLHRAMNTINPHHKKMEREKVRQALVQHYEETRVREHQRILARHKIIEDRKEYLERLNSAREEEEMRRQEEAARAAALAEQRRLEQEREERERRRQQSEIQQIRDRNLKEKMQQISQTSHGQKILKKLDEDDIKKLDAEQIAAREAEELMKERREMQQKLKSQEKKVDYFERAKRIEEIPLFEKAFKEKQIQDRKTWEEQEQERINQLIAEREIAVQHRERLKRMHADRDAFLEKLKAERRTVYLEKYKEFEKKLDEERKKRLEERKAKRREDRRLKWEREREEEERRKKEEEQRQREEEERRRKEEEEEKRRQKLAEEEEARRKKLEAERREAEQQADWRAREREREREREAERSTWRRPVSSTPINDVSDGPPRRDMPTDWRKGGSSGTPLAAASTPSKPEVWRSSRLRGEMEGSSWRRAEPVETRDGPDRFGSRDGERFGDRFGDRSRDGERFGDRGRDTDDRFDRSRDERFGDRGRDSDRFGDRSRDSERFPDRGRSRDEIFGDRGRESERFPDRDRDGFGGSARDKFGSDRDRFSSDRDRFGERGSALDRSRDRPLERTPMATGSWRAAQRPVEPEANDDDRRSAARRPLPLSAGPRKDTMPMSDWRSGGGKDNDLRSGPTSATPDGRRAPAGPDRRGDPLRENRPRPGEQQPPPIGVEDGDDGNWQKVGRR